jgi:hypothetical protein
MVENKWLSQPIILAPGHFLVRLLRKVELQW